MTGVEGSDSEVNRHSETDDGPGWGLPLTGPESAAPPGSTGDNEAPLTELQQEVVGEGAKTQRELGTEEWWRKQSPEDLLGGRLGGGMVASEIDSAWRRKPTNGSPPPNAKPNSWSTRRTPDRVRSRTCRPVANRHGRRSMRPRCIPGHTTGWPRPSNTTVGWVRLPVTPGHRAVRPTRHPSVSQKTRRGVGYEASLVVA